MSNDNAGKVDRPDREASIETWIHRADQNWNQAGSRQQATRQAGKAGRHTHKQTDSRHLNQY